MALDRSVNRESKAFMGSILDGVVNTEGDDAAGAEVAFILGVKKRRHIRMFTICIAWRLLKGAQTSSFQKRKKCQNALNGFYFFIISTCENFAKTM